MIASMDEVASLPPGLPRDDPTTSYWQMHPDGICDVRTTDKLPESADFVIIGSGISGACIANNLLDARPTASIVMLEARQAASGASGRNGGHTKHASYRTFKDNLEHHGAQDAIKIAKLEYDCMRAVHDFAEKHGIHCDSVRCDTVDIFYDQPQLETGKQAVDLMKKHIGETSPVTRYTIHSRAEAATNFLTPNSLGALQYEAGSLSAYKFTIGVLKLALAKGLNLQCNTPAISITKCQPEKSTSNSYPPTRWQILTPHGSITTSTLVLATNGYTAHLLPSLLQGVIVPFRGIVTAHRPGTSFPQQGLPTTYSFIYEKGYEYMITRPKGSTNEGDIVIGGGLTKGAGPDGLNEYGNTDDTVVDADIEAYLRDTTVEFFGQENWGQDHPDGRVRHAWSGIMGYSADGHPLVGPVPGQEGLYLDVSFQGHGMVLCFLCAKAIVDMIVKDEDSGDVRQEKETKLGEWFPDCFRVSEERLQKKFGGRMQVNKATEVGQEA